MARDRRRGGRDPVPILGAAVDATVERHAGAVVARGRICSPIGEPQVWQDGRVVKAGVMSRPQKP